MASRYSWQAPLHRFRLPCWATREMARLVRREAKRLRTERHDARPQALCVLS
jgi:hypothetical protein